MSRQTSHKGNRKQAATTVAGSSLWADDRGGLELPDEHPAITIRDSLHDLIPLGALEEELISTPEFLRLQGIKQLGFCYRIWPGATHTRFEHSLGVYMLMLRALRMVSRLRLAALDQTSARTLLVAALLHDVGHYPFSHAIEELGGEIAPHERVGREIITSDPIASIVRRHGLSPERIAGLIDRDTASEPPAIDSLLSRLLSGPLDMDKLDYLPRDARACNVPYGGVDTSRLLASLRVIERDGAPSLGLVEKGVSPLHSLIHARQEMFDNVYWHHTNRAMMAMLLRATQDALDAGSLQPGQLKHHEDASLLALLATGAMPESTRQLVSALALRRPHKVLLEIAAPAGRIFSQLDALFWDQAHRKRVEAHLAAAIATTLGEPIHSHEVLIDIPKPEKWQTDVLIWFPQPPVGMSQVMTWTEATGQQPHDLLVYEQHQRRIRVVGTAWLRERLGGDATRVILPLLERLPG